MANSEVGSQLHGLLLVDKPTGVTSHDVVSAVRKILGIKAVGHTGTLDPLATGLMVMLLGEGTKISQYILAGDKGYQVKVRLGITTDTLDLTGQVESRQDVALSAHQIKAVAEEMVGDLQLAVPNYSAVKRDGKKLYELAREELPVDAPIRTMRFFDVQVLETGPDWFSAIVYCEKGGYIRSWAKAIGEALGVGAAVEELRRIYSAPYRVESAVDLEKLRVLVAEVAPSNLGALGAAYIPLNRALPEWKAITVGGRDEHLMVNGQVSHDLNRRLIVEKKVASQSQAVVPIKVLSSSSGQLLSILEALPEGGLKIRRIFLAPLGGLK